MISGSLLKKVSSVRLLSLDTNFYIYVFEGNRKYFKKARYILDFVEKNQMKLSVSIMTYLEVLSHSMLTQDQVSLYSGFFEESQFIELRDVDVVVARQAALLRRKYNLKTPDATILASAIESGAELFITADERLKKVEEIEVVVFG